MGNSWWGDDDDWDSGTDEYGNPSGPYRPHVSAVPPAVKATVDEIETKLKNIEKNVSTVLDRLDRAEAVRDALLTELRDMGPTEIRHDIRDDLIKHLENML